MSLGHAITKEGAEFEDRERGLYKTSECFVKNQPRSKDVTLGGSVLVRWRRSLIKGE